MRSARWNNARADDGDTITSSSNLAAIIHNPKFKINSIHHFQKVDHTYNIYFHVSATLLWKYLRLLNNHATNDEKYRKLVFRINSPTCFWRNSMNVNHKLTSFLNRWHALYTRRRMKNQEIDLRLFSSYSKKSFNTFFDS